MAVEVPGTLLLMDNDRSNPTADMGVKPQKKIRTVRVA